MRRDAAGERTKTFHAELPAKAGKTNEQLIMGHSPVKQRAQR